MLKSRIFQEPPLVGREKEFEELFSVFKSAVQGKGATVFVCGEAGSGKTKLVTDFLLAAERKAAIITLKGWCLSDAGIPYFPFIEAFSTFYSNLNKTSGSFQEQAAATSRETGEVEINAWLKGPVRLGLSSALQFTPEAWKDLTFAAVKKALSAISNDKPVVLFLDDIQWADSASLALLQYLSRTLQNERVLVIATYRSEDLSLDNQGYPHPLAETLRLMGRNALFREINLSGLTQTDVGLLAGNMIGGQVQSSFVHKLETESQGNPLFIVESLRMFYEKKCLSLNNDKWCLSTQEVGIPSKIKDIILHRVSRVKPEQKKILEVASVIGAKFDPQFLAEIIGIDTLRVIEGLDEISHLSSLVKCEGNQYSFDHVKSRDAIYSEVSPALRKVYHEKIAQKIEAKPAPKPVSDLAYHYSKAENKPKAIKYSLAAGNQALDLFLGTEAIKHFQYVLDNVSNDPQFTQQREAAIEGLGDGLFANARSKAVEAFEQLSMQTGSDVVRLRAIRKAARASLIEGNYKHALELVNNTELSNEKLENARFLQVKGMIEGWGGLGTEAIRDSELALSVFEEEFSLLDEIDALTQVCIGYIIKASPNKPASLGQPENALASIIRSLSMCNYCQNLVRQVDANLMAFIIHNKCSLVKQAQEVVDASQRAVQKISDPVSRAANEASSRWMQGFLIEVKAMDKILAKLPLDTMQNFGTGAKLKFYMSGLLSGVLAEFKQDLKKAVETGLVGTELAEETDFYESQALLYANLAREYSELGQLKQAEVYYQKMEKIFQETTLTGFVFAHVIHLFTRAVYFSSKHEWDKANQAYDEVLAFYLSFSPPTGIMAGIRRGYCWTLLQQGRFEEAKIQYIESKKTLSELEPRLVHANIMGYLMAPKEIYVQKEFNIRLDLVNVAKNPAVLFEISELLPKQLKIISATHILNIKDGTVDMGKKTVAPFNDEAITLTVKATETGTFNLSPKIKFIDDLGQQKTCTPKPITVTAQPATKNVPSESHEIPQSDAEIELLKKFGLSRQDSK